MAVGDLEAAEQDFKTLMSDGFATDAHRTAGREGLRQLRIEAKRDRHKVATLFQGVTSQVTKRLGASVIRLPQTCFSSGRETDVVTDHAPTTQPTDKALPTSRRRYDEPLPMEPGAYIKLLESMLRAYTVGLAQIVSSSYLHQFPSVASQLETLRHSVDYNERKIIIKLQTVLPAILVSGCSLGQRPTGPNRCPSLTILKSYRLVMITNSRKKNSIGSLASSRPVRLFQMSIEALQGLY